MTGAEVSPATLLGTSFLASIIVPVSSEVALFAVLKLNAALFWPRLA